MTVAVADQLAVSYIKEATWGAEPAGNFQLLRLRSESLKRTQTTVDSQEIRSDRATTDTIVTEVGASGGLEVELSHTTYDDLIAGAFWADAAFTAEEKFTADDDIGFQSIASSSSGYAKILDDSDGLAPFNVNEWIQISGSTVAGNNTVRKIVSVAAGEFEVTVGDLTTVAFSAEDPITLIQAGSITNGSTQASFTLEKEFSNLSTLNFLSYLGMIVDTFSLQIAPGGPLTGSFGFLGKTTATASATLSDAGRVAAPTTKIFSTVTHITSLQGDQGVANTFVAQSAVTDFSFDIANNLRSRFTIGGGTGPHSVGEGKFGVSGGYTTLYEDSALFTLWEADTSTSLAIVMDDGLGNIYVLDLPNVQFTDAERVAGGESTDIVAAMQYRAHLHTGENIVARLSRITA